MAFPRVSKYLFQNRWAHAAVTLTDLLLARSIGCFIKKNRIIKPPRSLLLCNGAHLGDAILSTAVLPVLKSVLPETKIGFLAGSWSRAVFEGHPLVDWVHVVDHWKHNRSPLSLKKKCKHYWHTRQKALSEIKKIGYEAAVDLYFYFPNFAALLWEAKIPTRIGYVSAGFSPLLTHALPWSYKEVSVVCYFLDLLDLLTPLEAHRDKAKPTLYSSKVTPKLDCDNYLLIHMGSGSTIKEWPGDKWRILAQKLVQEGFFLVFTGKGDREHAQISAVIQNHSRMINLCNQLNWAELIAIVAGAKLLISVDTGLGHIASATDTPALLLFTGMNPQVLWRPLGTHIHVLTHATPCAPCFRSHGCAQMSCIRSIDVDTVYRAVTTALSFSTKT